MKTSRPPLPYLTGFRAIAAYLVLFGHSMDTAFSYRGISFLHDHVAVFAYLGMTLFFVLSGFVITYSYYDRFVENGWRHAFRDFFVARFARLYPLYCVFFLVEYYALFMLRAASMPEKISYLTLTQSWWNFQSLILPPTWSVSTEWFFYAAFAAAMGLVAWRGKPANYAKIRARALIFVVTFMALLMLAFFLRGPITACLEPIFSHRGNRNVWEWFQYFSPYVRLGEFIMGALAARLYMLSSDGGKHKLSGRLCIACIAAIGLIGLYNATHFGYATFLFFLSTNFACAPFIAYLLFACGCHPNRLTRWLSGKWIVAGGEISYSLYLMQFCVYWKLSRYLPQASWTEPSFAEWFLLSFHVLTLMMVTTLVAICTYRFIETPSRRWIRKRAHFPLPARKAVP